ncbi:hypothetical protein KCP70_06680 [Salmonella enterica subsp. enterica]|nr:hypothetical protein KCP70_06680 [Salmonella enterica subsp. enterica]
MHGLLSADDFAAATTTAHGSPLLHDLTNEGLAFGHELLRRCANTRGDQRRAEPTAARLYLPEGGR